MPNPQILHFPRFQEKQIIFAPHNLSSHFLIQFRFHVCADMVFELHETFEILFCFSVCLCLMCTSKFSQSNKHLISIVAKKRCSTPLKISLEGYLDQQGLSLESRLFTSESNHVLYSAPPPKKPIMILQYIYF